MLAFVVVIVLGCSRGLKPEQATAWLASQGAQPELNVAGDWESTAYYMAGGWGSGNFVQDGARVFGTLGPYTLEGKVSGKKLYAVLLSNGSVHYTSVLEMIKPNELAGNAVYSMLPNDPKVSIADNTPVHLIRPKSPEPPAAASPEPVKPAKKRRR